MNLQEIGHYRVLRRLGEGGMASVYLAQDTHLDRYVAIKLLSQHHTRDEFSLERFRREARLASTLNHPNVLTIHEMGESDGLVFLVTEYVDGETLRKALSHGPLPILEAVQIIEQVAAALTAAHDYWVIHRDLKPENVMIRADGVVKLLDFGFAKLSFGANPSLTSPGTVPGSILYTAPERLLGEEADPRCDIFSLGVMAWEMIGGRPPYTFTSMADAILKVTNEDAERLDEAVPDTPEDLVEIIHRALLRDPSIRYQTIRQVGTGIRAIRQRLEWESLAQNTDQ